MPSLLFIVQGITTSHAVAGLLIGANGFLRNSPAWRNLQGKVVGGIAAVALTYMVTATATKESVIRSHQHSRNAAKADTALV